MTDDDMVLLAAYASTGADEAFSELVRRHVDFVYSVAIRTTPTATDAEDVMQSVFSDLAKKARFLIGRKDLIGWLYISTCHASRTLLRRERRRRLREQRAEPTPAPLDAAGEPDWRQIGFFLDGVLCTLGERDRDALILRFFKNASFAEVAERLNIGENAARMCVTRALEKVKKLLGKRGVRSTALAIEAALASQVTIAAPAGWAATISQAATMAAFSGGAAPSGLQIFFPLMKAKTLTTSAGILAAIIGIGVAMKEHQARRTDENRLSEVIRQRDALQQDLAAAKRQNERLMARSSVPPPSAKPQERPLTYSIAKNSASKGPNSDVDPNQKRTQELFAKQYRLWFRMEYGPLINNLHLSSEQAARFEDAVMEGEASLLDVTAAASAVGASPKDQSINALRRQAKLDSENEVRTVLGEDGYEQYASYNKTLPARDAVSTLAGDLYATGTPLTAEQGTELINILSSNATSAAVDFQTQGVLTQQQLTVFRQLEERNSIQKELSTASRLK